MTDCSWSCSWSDHGTLSSSGGRCHGNSPRTFTRREGSGASQQSHDIWLSPAVVKTKPASKSVPSIIPADDCTTGESVWIRLSCVKNLSRIYGQDANLKTKICSPQITTTESGFVSVRLVTVRTESNVTCVLTFSFTAILNMFKNNNHGIIVGPKLF